MTHTTFSPVAVLPPPVRPKVRPARPQDIPALLALIQFYAEKGILLPRTEEELRETIGDFRVISSKNRLLACAVLQLYSSKTAELRSLAVTPGLHGAGLGRRLVEVLLEEARARDLEMVFAFTYAPEFFARFGFAPIDRGLLPWKVWKDCLYCPKRECCDEIAIACRLKPPAVRPTLMPILPNRPPDHNI